MSFSSDVKEEIAKQINSARHCQLAELSVIVNNCGSIRMAENGSNEMVIALDREPLFRKCFTLLNKTYNISNVSLNEEKLEIVLNDNDQVWNILKGLCLISKEGVFRGFHTAIDPVLIKNACCKRAFLKGAFLCLGSMSDPKKGYHLELVCENEDMAVQISEVLTTFDIEAKIILRKKYYVVYIKEGSSIVDFLNVCEAHVSLMELENLRILKEMSNSVNRRVNCETANIAKTVVAAEKQIQDIILIRDYYGFEKLQDGLREVAEVRLEYPDVPLKELGALLNPPLGKSGVNHRLRKLSEIAEGLRE